MRPAHRPDLFGVVPGVGGRPSDDLSDLGLAVAIEHRDAELVGEPTGRQGRERRGDAPHVAQRRQIGDVRIVGEHHHGGRRQDGGANGEAADERGELRGAEAVHEHERSSGPQSEQDVVDAGVERQGHRYQVRRGRAGRIGRPAPQRTEDTVEQLQVPGVRLQDRLRPSRGSGRPGDEGRSRARSGWASTSARGALRRRRSRRRGRSMTETWSSSAWGCRGLAGTNTAPASQTPNMAKTNSGPFGSWTTTAWPGSTPADAAARAARAASARAVPAVTLRSTVLIRSSPSGKGCVGQQVRQAACGPVMTRPPRRRPPVTAAAIADPPAEPIRWSGSG